MPIRAPTPENIAAAVERLRNGELVALPTETVYGLAGDARDPRAVQRIFALKGRPTSHPLIVHLPDLQHLDAWVQRVPPAALLLAETFWPGPLTLVLERSARVSDAITGGQDSVALRVPAHPVAQRVLQVFGGGLAAPSANRYGRVSPTTAAHVLDEFGAESPLILDGGACEVGIESTIVDARGEQLKILRPGIIDAKTLAAVVGPLAAAGGGGAVPRVSGSDAAHYAPNTPLLILPLPELLRQLSQRLAAGSAIEVLASQDPEPNSRSELRQGKLRWQALGSDAASYAHELYAALRDADAANAALILVEQPPAAAEWIAIHDRLRRAAAGSQAAASASPGA
jgi:L-threonylcarbamoyladenylate synthase